MHEVNPKDATWLLDEKYHGERSAEYEKDMERLAAGEPLAYVIGFVPFLGTRIELESRPLIPRTETEYWVESAIADIRTEKGDAPLRILDIFAGSGCIGIALAHHLSNATVDFAEKDPRHVEQIARNCSANNIAPDRIHIYESDVFSRVPKAPYDYIFANPPYIAEDMRSPVQESVLAHEPHDALFGGTDGLRYIEQLLAEAPQHLSSDGTLFIEYDPWQKDEIEKLATQYGYVSHSILDQYGKPRVLHAKSA